MALARRSGEEVVRVLLTSTSGAKVGWNYWSTREEAEVDSRKQRYEAERKAALGYDFGYMAPGEVQEVVLKQDLRQYGARDERYPVVAREGETVFIVTTP